MSRLELPPSAALSQLLSSGPLGLVVLDNEARVTWANEALLELLGTDVETLLNRPAAELRQPWLRALAEQSEFIHIPGHTEGDTEGGRWLHCRFTPLRGTAGAVGHVLDFTEIKALIEERDALKEKVAALDPVDPVTGLLNARGMNQALAPQVSRSRRYGNHLSVVLLRLGTEGEFERQFPSDSGESVLVAVTQLLNEQMRWADFIGRMDGGEFLLVLQETAAKDAAGLVAKLRDALSDLCQSVTMPIAQFGVAEWQKGDDVGLLLRRARQELDSSS